MLDWPPNPRIEASLSGGHPNSLGNTEAVVAEVLAGTTPVDALFDSYGSPDAVVRLRVSSAIKRIVRAQPEWIAERYERLLEVAERLDQPSAQWTFSQVSLEIAEKLSAPQRARATALMLGFLRSSGDWIVQNHTMATLAEWSRTDPALRDELMPLLLRFAESPLRSVAKRARRSLATD